MSRSVRVDEPDPEAVRQLAAQLAAAGPIECGARGDTEISAGCVCAGAPGHDGRHRCGCGEVW